MFKAAFYTMTLSFTLLACDSTAPRDAAPPPAMGPQDSIPDVGQVQPKDTVPKDTVPVTPIDTTVTASPIIGLRPTTDGTGEYVLELQRSFNNGITSEVVHGNDTVLGGNYTFAGVDSISSYGPLTCSPTYTSEECVLAFQSTKRTTDSTAAAPKTLVKAGFNNVETVKIMLSGKPMTCYRATYVAGKMGATQLDIIDSAAGVIFDERSSWMSGVASTSSKFQRLNWNGVQFDTAAITAFVDSITRG